MSALKLLYVRILRLTLVPQLLAMGRLDHNSYRHDKALTRDSPFVIQNLLAAFRALWYICFIASYH